MLQPLLVVDNNFLSGVNDLTIVDFFSVNMEIRLG
jgi:hypothetical protein